MNMRLRVNTKENVEGNLLELNEEIIEPLSPTSELLLSEIATLYILSFFELEIPVDFPSTIAFLSDVFINVHPRLSSIVIENKRGRKMWKKVAVDVEDHIKVPSFPEGLSIKDYNEQFDNYTAKIATSQLPQDKPLWELHVINCPKVHTSAAVFIFKFHHAVGDGTSLMRGLLSCIKRVDDPSLPLTFPSKDRSTSRNNEHCTVANTMTNMFKIVREFLSSVIYSLYDFAQGVRLLLTEDSVTPIRSGTTDMTRPFSTGVYSVNLSLNGVKRIKALLGVTVNDIIVGIIFLGTRLYIKEVEQTQEKKRRSTASIFVNIRSGKGNGSLEEMRKAKTWGNRITNIELPLPIFDDEDVADPLTFIKKAHKIIKKKRFGIYGPFLMAGLLDTIRAFAGFQTAAKTFERRWKNSSFAITNIIGPTEKFSFANHPVKGFYFVPTGINVSLVVSVLSYVEELRFGLVVEKGFIDHQRLIICVENAFQMIFEAAQATSSANIVE
ncbi:O-acyltransferase WSD1 [Bienertia sinuspersici]